MKLLNSAELGDNGDFLYFLRTITNVEFWPKVCSCFNSVSFLFKKKKSNLNSCSKVSENYQLVVLFLWQLDSEKARKDGGRNGVEGGKKRRKNEEK